MTLVFVPLSEAAEINPRAPKLSADTKVSFLPMADVSDAGLTHVTSFRRYEEVKTGYTAFQDKDVLVAKVTPCFENNKIAQADLPTTYGFGSTEFHVVRSRENADNRYLFHFLRQDWVRYEGERRMTGSGGQRRVPKGFLEELQIPLPSLPEQRRIAGILDQADAVRRLRRQSLSRLSDLGQAIFETEFGNVECVVPLELAVDDTLIGLVRNGESFGPDFAVPYVRMDAISSEGAFLPTKVQRTDASNQEIKRYALETGDILFNTRNSKELVGKTAIYRGSGPSTFNNNIMRIRMKPDWDAVFVEAFLRSQHGRSELEKRKSGTTSVWAVYWSQLKTLKIPMPSRAEQARFRNQVETIWSKLDLLENQRRQIDSLFASLQHRAFRGEL